MDEKKAPEELLQGAEGIFGNPYAVRIVEEKTPDSIYSYVVSWLGWPSSAGEQFKIAAQLKREFPETWEAKKMDIRACNAYDFSPVDPAIIPIPGLRISTVLKMGGAILSQEDWPILFREFQFIGDRTFSSMDGDGELELNGSVKTIKTVESRSTVNDFYNPVLIFENHSGKWGACFFTANAGSCEVPCKGLENEKKGYSIGMGIVESCGAFLKVVRIHARFPSFIEEITAIFRIDQNISSGCGNGVMVYSRCLQAKSDDASGLNVTLRLPFAIYRPGNDHVSFSRLVNGSSWAALPKYGEDWSQQYGFSLQGTETDAPSITLSHWSFRGKSDCFLNGLLVRDQAEMIAELIPLARVRKENIPLEKIFGIDFFQAPPMQLLDLLI